MASGDLTGSTPTLGFRECAVFDGVDDNITLSDIPEVGVSKSFTVALNVFFEKDAEQAIFTQTRTTSDRVHLTYVNNRIRAGTRDNVANISMKASNDATITTNKWYNIIFTNDGSTIKLWQDGVEQTLDTNSPSTSSSLGIKMGQMTNGLIELKGGISDVRIWNRVLDSTEISKVSEGQEINSGLSHWWKLQENYTDFIGSNDGSNTGSYLTNTYPNKLLAQINHLNLGAATDNLIVTHGRAGNFLVTGVEREA